MSDTTQTETLAETATEAAEEQESFGAGFAGAAGFADAETREILNLLGDQSGGSCCGGSCCSA